ncbi:hypothetical protein [Streptomyces chartreusis]|uniref:hypothetical protein n=1 Tax=Streptomyces chartreusis TaxID=1969 RepID=UPI003697C87B
MTRFVRLKSAVTGHPIAAVTLVGLLLVALGGAAELVAQKAVADQIREDPALSAADATVHLGDNWALAALAGQRMEEVDIVADNATLGPFTGVSLQVEVYGLRLGSAPEFERIHGLAVLDASAIAEVFKKEARGMGVTSVVMNSLEQTISVLTSGVSAPKQIVLRPESTPDGSFVLEPVGDAKSAEGVLPGQGAGLSGPQDPMAALGLKVQAVAVGRDSLRLVLDGDSGKLQS